ncbi:MAG: hypothetical protein WA629_05375 [Candidatus Aquilonibacter sp.]
MILLLALLLGGVGRAAPVASPAPGTELILQVDATTTIALVLLTFSGACTLVNSNSNAAAVDLGQASSSANTSCATYSSGNPYQLATSLSVESTCSGTCSNWNLTAQLNSAAQTGTTWRAGSTNLTTAAQTIASSLSYAASHTEALRLTVSTSNAPTGALQQAITFTATANGAAASASATLNLEEINQPGIAIFLVADASGAPITGGAFNAGLNFGTVAAAGVLPAGVTRPTVTASSFTVATIVDIDVEKSGGFSSSNYTMRAALAAAAPTGLTYLANAVTLTTSPQTITSTGTYNSNQAYTLDIVIKTAAPGSGGPTVGSLLSDTIDFTATAN